MITVAALAVALIVVPAASAKIHGQKSIAGIAFERIAAAVLAKKGAPDADKIVANEILGQQRKMRYGSPGVLRRHRRQRHGHRPGDQEPRSADQHRRRRRLHRGGVVAAVRRVRCKTEFGFRPASARASIRADE